MDCGASRGRTARTHWIGIGSLVVVVLALRLCYLVVASQNAATAIRRPHIESGALLWGIAGLAFRFSTDLREVAKRELTSSLRWPLWLGFVSAALVMYWPTIFLGFLSDDFILVQRAAEWNVAQVAPQLLRPLPIFVWAVILHVGGAAKAIHILNILLHATNAYLASAIVAGWVPATRWAAIAGLLVVAAPLGPEAVAWSSGAFDLFAAASLMSAVLVARRSATSWNNILFVALALAALLSKETAVVLPLLVLVDGWIRGTVVRRLLLNVTISSLIVMGFAAVRLQSAGNIDGFSRYRLQRLVFDSFGGLVAPWHAHLTASEPLLRPVIAILIIIMLTGFFLLRGPRWRSKVALGAAMWVFVSVLPLITMFYVSPQLEGARYLYLASAGWAALLVVASSEMSEARPCAGAIGLATVAVVLLAGVVGVRAHLGTWTQAAKTRDLVMRSAAADRRLLSCDVVYVQNLPASVDGAYVFANGAREALSALGINAFVRNESGPCSFHWEPTNGTFVPSSPLP